MEPVVSAKGCSNFMATNQANEALRECLLEEKFVQDEALTRLLTDDIEPEDRRYIVNRLRELEIYSANQINAIAEFINNRLRTYNNYNNRRIEAITSLLDAGLTTSEVSKLLLILLKTHKIVFH